MSFVNVGRNMIRDWMSGGGYSGDFPQSITMGSGTTASVVTDTALEHEIGSTSNAGSIYRICPMTSVAVANQEVRYEAVFPSIVGSNTTFSEIGIFNRSGTGLGSLFARAVFNATQKTINEEWDTLCYIKLG